MFTKLITLSVVAGAVLAPAVVLTSGSARAAAPRHCSVQQLSATFAPGSPGAGNRYSTLTLRNRSSSGCDTGGYVGLGLENAADHSVATKAVRVDPSRQHAIYLAPGKRATTLLHWAVIPGTGDRAGGPCFTAPTHILVTPPDSYSSLQLRWTQGAVCEGGRIDITPLAYAG